MEKYLFLILPVYFVVYFLWAFVIRSWMVYRSTGINPMVLPRDDSAYGLVGFYFKLTVAGIFVYVLLYAWVPGSHRFFLTIQLPYSDDFQGMGLVILGVAMVWTIIAQGNMKDSWRVGIDSERKTELITEGLFRYSRNPIFLGMLLVLAGLFLVTPNAATLIFWVVGYILIQVQIRLEEEYLRRQHGETYATFCRKVSRRLIL
ncbi:MAG: methyltransferase family protein [Sediminibacterium sp.]